MSFLLEVAFVLMMALCLLGIISCLVACGRVLKEIVTDVLAIISEHKAGNGWNLPKMGALWLKKS